MKRIYLTLMLFSIVGILSAQQVNRVIAPQITEVSETSQSELQTKVKQLKKKVTQRRNNSKSTNSRWYNTAFTRSDILGSSVVSANYLFPDTTILVNYGTSGYLGPWIHSLGECIDPTSDWFTDSTQLEIDEYMPYYVDSVGIYGIYSRNVNVVDTLAIQLRVSDVSYYYYSGWTLSYYGVDTVKFRDVPFDAGTLFSTDAGVTTIKIPLTAAVYADTLASGILYIKASANNFAIPAGQEPIVTYSFIPGYTWNANVDTLSSMNSFRFISDEENGSASYPIYSDGDFSASYILMTSGLTDPTATSYTSTYGFLETYQYEHHWVELLLTSSTVSQLANISTFSFAEQTNPAIIDPVAATVDIEVANGTDLTALIPTITVSIGATISPDSGVVQDYTVPVSYIVTAENSSTKNWTVNVSVAAPTPVVTIYDIQGQIAASPYAGIQVITSGIVTATSNNGYWIQGGDGAWNGIYVYDNGNTPAIGDNITIEGEVAEYYDLTQIKNIVSFVVNSSSNTLPAAQELSTAACNEEMYESVLVKVAPATCINADAGYGMWTINDGATTADSVQVDDVMFAFTPTVGVQYWVRGVMYYGFGASKILPRDADDVVIHIGVNQSEEAIFSVYPNPAVNEINLVNIKNVYYVTVSDVTGKVVANIDVTSENVKINTSELEAGIYFVSAFYNNGNVSTVKFIKK